MPRLRKRAADVVFALLVLATLVLGALVIGLATGRFVRDPAQTATSGPAAAATTRPEVKSGPPAATTVGAVPLRAAPLRPPNHVSVIASRGDCWVSARRGGPTGEILFAGTLARGKTLRLVGRRISLDLGAAANVDVLVDGKPRTVPSGTVRVLLSG